MSTRNKVNGYIVIPVPEISDYYSINNEGTIIRFLNKEEDDYDIVYEWKESTSEIPFEFKVEDIVIRLTPISLYMLAYYGYCKLPIANSEFADKCKYAIWDADVKISEDGKTCLINGEVFKQTKTIPEYYVNEYGCIYSSKTNIMVKHFLKYVEYNYKRVLKTGIHRLVYEAWIGELKPGCEVHHKDETDWNNHYSNLEQLTKHEHNVNHGGCLYSDEKIHAVCKDLSDGIHIYETARRNDVSPSVVSNIYRGKSYKSISSKYVFPVMTKNKFSKKLSESDVIEICKLFQEHILSDKEIGEIYSVAKDTIRDIRKRRSFRSITSEYEFSSLDVGQTEEMMQKQTSVKSKRNASITEEQVVEIWRYLQSGMMIIDIAEKTGISKNIISKIKQRYRWSSVTDTLGPLPSDN